MTKTPITIETFKDLKQFAYRLALHCLNCNRWHHVDLNAIIEEGRGDEVYVGRKFKCEKCGEIAEKQIQLSDWSDPHAPNPS